MTSERDEQKHSWWCECGFRCYGDEACCINYGRERKHPESPSKKKGVSS